MRCFLPKQVQPKQLNYAIMRKGVNMDLEKYKERIDSSEVVEELIDLSNKIFAKSSDDPKKIVEMLITQSYLMGKRNAVKTFDSPAPAAELAILNESQ